MTPTLAQQIAEAQRELRKRYEVYPGLVARGSITQVVMDRRIALQHAIIATLEHAAKQADCQISLFATQEDV